MPDYNHAVIRELLSQAFDTAEINTLAFDLFPKLRADFPEAMSRSVRIERIVDHARRNGRFPPLLEYVKTQNKHQYAHFADRLIQEEAPEATTVAAAIAELETKIETLFLYKLSRF